MSLSLLRSRFALFVVAVVSTGTVALAPSTPVAASVLPSVGAGSSQTAQVAIGSQHVVAVGSNGTVWTWGSLVPGPTGVGSRDALRGPTQVILPDSRTAVDVAATHNASFAVATDGTVWGWGSLGNGLGDASLTSDARYTSPVQITFPSGVSIEEVSAACEGVMARSSTGQIFQWGTFWGSWQMNSRSPSRVEGITAATSISRGCSASFAVLQNGTAMAWGSNGGGRLGDGTTTDRLNPVSISLPDGKSFSTISTSSSHSLAIATDGSLYAWGGNANGQLGADPNAIAFHATPRSISLGNSTAVSVAASDNTPFSTVVTSANTVFTWGNWGTNGFAPTRANLPTSDLGNRVLRSVTTSNNGVTYYVANDASLWGKAWWSSVDLDGNCGANASDHPTWINGVTLPARPLVRTISQGQFGAMYFEDSISVSKLETGTGAVLPLDGSGTLSGAVDSNLSVVLTGPRSNCYSTDQLTYEMSLDNGSTWSSSGVTTSLNDFAQTIVTIAFTPTVAGRNRAFVRITNPDNQRHSYRFNLGIAARSSSDSPVAVGALPIVTTDGRTSLAIGTDGFLYAWGTSRFVTGESSEVVQPKRLIPRVLVSGGEQSNTTTSTVPVTSTTTVPPTTVAPATTTTIPVATSTTTTSTSSIPPTTTVSPTTTVVSTTIAPTTTISSPQYEFLPSLRFRSVAFVPNTGGSGLPDVAAAVSEDGRLFTWGQASAGQFLNSVSNVETPTLVPTADGLILREVFIQTISTWDCSISPCSNRSEAVGFALDANGAVFAWGGLRSNSNQCCATGNDYGLSPSRVPVLSGLNFSSMVASSRNALGMNLIFLRNQGGEVFWWSPTSAQAGTVPRLLGVFTERFVLASDTILDINQNGKLVQRTLNMNLELGEPTIIELPEGRRIRQLSTRYALAEDGTVWDFSSLRWNDGRLRQVNVPLSARPVVRFASTDMAPSHNWSNDTYGYLLSGSGHLFSSLSSPAGTCAWGNRSSYSWSDERFRSRRVASSGQFGPAFTEDAFYVGVDSPRLVEFMEYGDGWRDGRVPNAVLEDGQGVSDLRIRPDLTVDLYAYVKSTCDGVNQLAVSWDLDDDGVYETSSSIQNVEPRKTLITTPDMEDEYEPYEGLDSSYRQAKLTVSSDSLGGALTQGGGRFIGIRVSSGLGSVTQRVPVVVVPQKPAGRVGITINNAARFTDSSSVELGVVWPEGNTSMIVSNDGSFADAQEIPVTSRFRWNLPAGGSGLLPTTVYVRFGSLWSNGSSGWYRNESEYSYTDDIVLDLSPPVVASASASANSFTESVQSMSSVGIVRRLNSTSTSALVSLSVFDAISGIAAIQVTNDPAVPGPERPLSTSVRIPVTRETVAVRAKDNVGHWSNWHYVRVAGFTANPEAPSARPTPQLPAPAAPDTPVAPVAPQIPVPQFAPPVQPQITPAVPAVPRAAATARLQGTRLTVRVQVPAELARVCKTTRVKRTRTTTCTPSKISVSVAKGATRTVDAKRGNNNVVVQAKKNATVTVRLNGKVIQRITAR
jgi:alpha-tubulin suppressor-like RCC1 family protein